MCHVTKYISVKDYHTFISGDNNSVELIVIRHKTTPIKEINNGR